MASALVNTAGPPPPPPEGFLDLASSGAAYPSYGWLGPRMSFSQEFPDDDDQPPSAVKPRPSTVTTAGDVDLVVDFEFRRLDDPVAMLPADELFSDGKLVPLHLAPPPHPRAPPDAADPFSSAAEIWSPEPQEKAEEAASKSDPYAAFSPKAPSCTSRWRELLRLKKAAQGSGGAKSSSNCSSSAVAAVAGGSNGAAARSRKHLLQRNPKLLSSSVDASPPEREPASVPSRASLSSSSSSAPDNGDYPRLSVSTRPYQAAARGRVGRNPARGAAGEVPTRSASVDSPRMNPSGRVVFQGLGRSASSPSAIGGGGHRGRHHYHRGAERACPANAVRVAPVLNVPVFGFGQLFSSSQKRDPAAGARGSGGGRSGRTERA